MTLEAALFYYLLTVTFVFSPGPGVFAIIAKSLSTGIPSAFFISFGMMVIDLFYLLLACYGLSKIAETWSLLFLAVRFVGSCYLIYLGWKMFITKKNQATSWNFGHKKSSKGFYSNFFQGILIGISNPKVILFYLAFLPNFIDLENLNSVKLISILILTIAALWTGIIIITLTANLIKKFVQSNKGIKILHNVSGTLMILAGFYLVIDYWY